MERKELFLGIGNDGGELKGSQSGGMASYSCGCGNCLLDMQTQHIEGENLFSVYSLAILILAFEGVIAFMRMLLLDVNPNITA